LTMSGFSPEKLAKAEVEKTTSKTYEEFTAVKYKEQSGAGQTFIIKVIDRPTMISNDIPHQM
uniref:Cystatin domain-containing protein n=1 Tax=Lates calcarifer TaxID=8187 RepID=A0A4W6DLM1_LATCA